MQPLSARILGRPEGLLEGLSELLVQDDGGLSIMTVAVIGMSFFESLVRDHSKDHAVAAPACAGHAHRLLVHRPAGLNCPRVLDALVDRQDRQIAAPPEPAVVVHGDTLATQAISRGMSLEAIAALLGHTSMTMTLTYARIADRTVAQEYFAVSKKVEALYEPAPLPADAEGPNPRALRIESDRRLLGNGYCTRPAELGCRSETMCETCTRFATTIAFCNTLQNQRDNADAQGDTQRQHIYAKILKDLDKAVY